MPSWRKYRDAWQATHPTCRILPVPAEVGQRGWLVVRSSLLHHLIGDHRFPILGPGQPAPFAAIRPRQPPPGQEVDEAVEPGREPPQDHVHSESFSIFTGASSIPAKSLPIQASHFRTATLTSSAVMSTSPSHSGSGKPLGSTFPVSGLIPSAIPASSGSSSGGSPPPCPSGGTTGSGGSGSTPTMNASSLAISSASSTPNACSASRITAAVIAL